MECDFRPGVVLRVDPEARITLDGWTAYRRIPFTTSISAQSSDVVCGLNFKRFIRRKTKKPLLSVVPSNFWGHKVSQAGDREASCTSEVKALHLEALRTSLNTIIRPARIQIPAACESTSQYGPYLHLVLNLTGTRIFADNRSRSSPFNLTPFSGIHRRSASSFPEMAASPFCNRRPGSIVLADKLIRFGSWQQCPASR